MFSASLSFPSTDVVHEAHCVGLTEGDTLGPSLVDLGKGVHTRRTDTRLHNVRAVSGIGECLGALVPFSMLTSLFLTGGSLGVWTFMHLRIGGMVTWSKGLMPIREFPLGGSLFRMVSLGHS